MSRRALSIIVGVVGFVVGGLSLVALMVMGSLFADARTENIAGPGVDVFLKTPFPLEGGYVILDVEARGGSKAGVSTITIRADGATLVEKKGEGATWGYSISKGKDRGSDKVRVEFEVPKAKRAGDTLPLELQVSYVVAMSSGRSFSNENHHGEIRLDIDVHSPASRRFGQVKQIGAALGLLALWLLAVLGITKLYAQASEREPHVQAGEMEGISIVMGMIGGGIIGYWMFALRITDALEIDSLFVVGILSIAWIALPLYTSWKWTKRREAREPPRPRRVGGTDLGAAIAAARALPISHDAPTMSTTMLLEISKNRVRSLLDAAPELAAAMTWLEESRAEATTQSHPVLRRRAVALNWALVAASPTLLKKPATAVHAELVQAICDAVAITDDDGRQDIADRITAALGRSEHV